MRSRWNIVFHGFLIVLMLISHVFADSSIKEKKDFHITADSRVADYIRLGLMNNLALQAVYSDWQAKREAINQSASLPDPQLSYGEYIDSVETRVGPQNRVYGIKQSFPFPKKLGLQKKQAFQEAVMAFYDFEIERLHLINAIKKDYYEYLFLSKLILITKESMNLLAQFERVAQSKYTSGLTENHDLLRLQVELGQIESEIIRLEQYRIVLSTRLNVLLNVSLDNVLPWPNEGLETLPITNDYVDLKQLISEMEGANPTLKIHLERARKAGLGVQLAKQQYWPDVTLGLTYIDTGDALNRSTVDSGKDPLLAQISFQLPLWWSRIQSEARIATAVQQAAEKRYENKRQELISQLTLVHYHWRDAFRQSALYKTSLIPKAVQTLHATQAAYESSHKNFLSLMDAQRVLLNLQSAYYRHNANYYQRLSELQMLTGQLLQPIDDIEYEEIESWRQEI